MSWGEKYTSQYVEKNNQVAYEIVGFHDAPMTAIQAEIGAPFQIESRSR
jgi:hypothetical protein